MIPLIMPPWAKWAAVAVAAAALLVAFSAGWTARAWRADAQIARINTELAAQTVQAVRNARTEERRKQEKANEAIRKQAASVAAVNDALRRDLDELRHRPGRAAGVSQAARADCAGTTGAELSGEDAAFLAGEAARADLLRAALATCYEVMDVIENDPAADPRSQEARAMP